MVVLPLMPFILGLDVSTTASKALLLRHDGKVAGTASAPHDHSMPHPLWSEQDPQDWWHATQTCIQDVLATSGTHPAWVVGVSLTGQMHGLVMLGKGGIVLRPAMLWNDGRSTAQCDRIRALIGLERLVKITGNDAFAGFTAPKVLWVRDHEPDVYRQVRQILLPKDYIRYCLSGTYATDKAGAGGTLLLDLAARDWSKEMAERLEIPLRWLPPTYEGTAVTGTVTRPAAEATGLVAGTPIFAGGGDQAAQALGVGAVTPQTWALTLGTSGVVFAPCAQPRTAHQGRAHAFPHAVPGLWHIMGVMLSAAGSLAWYRDTLADGQDYNSIFSLANSVAPGSEGLVFLPYLTGERTPHADPHATGSFVGLTRRHTYAHLTRAVLEGVACGLKDNLTFLQEAGLPPPVELRLSGGGAKSEVWRQILADVLGVDLIPANVTEGAALGAAIAASVGLRWWPDVSAACQSIVRTGEPTRPGANQIRYQALHSRFASLYQHLKPYFAATHP